MADELREGLGVEAQLVAGGNGIFDVKVDNKLIFSKFETGRFPESGEVLRKIKT
ncbi:MAG: Rdx family protein [Dehalococcoidia bacterium]|nr:MAG: Rdx family protein [Dehalococcoidia bacterium]UCG84378.1 MAG: Rdx family protein [Dehalococcoidia bacterium]